MSLVVYVSIRSGDANATRILWKHDTIATAKIGIVTLEVSEAAAGARGSSSPSPFLPISRSSHRLAAAPLLSPFLPFIADYDSSRQLIPSLYYHQY